MSREQERTTQFEHDDGRWYLISMGTFIQCLVDSGRDPAIAMRVLEDEPADENGAWVRRMEVVQIPDGHVLEVAERLDCVAAESVIREMLESGVVT
jgi:hypothetical protein